MPTQRQIREEAIRQSVLIRDEDTAYWADFESWKRDIVELNFFNPSERAEADIDAILTEAWNFLSLIEEEDERQYELNDGYKDYE